MKALERLCLCLFLVLTLSSCDKIKDLFSSDKDNEDPNVLSGDSNTPVAQPGNTFTTSVSVGNVSYPNVIDTMMVIRNENGIATVKFVADLTKIPQLAPINSLIPDTYKDANGKVNAEVPFKITTEGMQDNLNKDRKYHTIVKYSASVGDQYKLTKSDGKTITRTVTAKSTTDDFPYGFMYIKTLKVEQDSRIPGVNKIIYHLNHKFGLVYVEIVPDAGSSVSSYFYTANY